MMLTPPTISPNVLDGHTLMAKMRVDGAWEMCEIRRVYYEDTKKTREIYVDAVCRSKSLFHIPFDAIHRYSTSGVVAYAFQQEERDRMLLHDRLREYACHVSFRLQQGRLRGVLVWHGVVVCQYPSIGSVYVRGRLLVRHPYIFVHSHVPFFVQVRERNKTIVAVKVMIDSVDDRAARVVLKGDVNILHTSIMIDDLAHSGKDTFNTYLEVLDA